MIKTLKLNKVLQNHKNNRIRIIYFKTELNHKTFCFTGILLLLESIYVNYN